MTLIELMIALTIGAFLMIGALTVLVQSRTTFRVTESIARLQENARFVLDALEPDVRMARYWGLTSRTHAVLGRASGTQPHAGLGPASCGANWIVDLDRIAGSNNRYGFGCAGQAPVETNADTLVVRRATEDPVAPPFEPAGVYLQSSRGGQPVAQLFVGASGVPPAFNPATSATYRLVVNGYYVSRSSSLGASVPSLRRKTLRATGTVGDEEVLPYVEDLQIQYGIDTSPPGSAERGAVNRYVNADDPVLTPSSPAFLPHAEVLAVRIWVRVRAEREETGYTNVAPYAYADRDYGVLDDGYRRLVVAKTIYLRNARPAF